jgi:hypothetical protein
MRWKVGEAEPGNRKTRSRPPGAAGREAERRKAWVTRWQRGQRNRTGSRKANGTDVEPGAAR